MPSSIALAVWVRISRFGTLSQIFCAEIFRLLFSGIESIAAMGRVHPFLERAGMTRYDPPIRAEHARLIDALERLGLEPHDLAKSKRVGECFNHLAESDRRWLQRELRIFRRKACMKRNHVHPDADIDTLLRAARDHVLARPVYYLWWRDGERRATT